MSNEELIRKLVQEYGREKVISFSRINAFKHMLLSLQQGIPADRKEQEESKWWLDKAQELDLKPINEY